MEGFPLLVGETGEEGREQTGGKDKESKREIFNGRLRTWLLEPVECCDSRVIRSSPIRTQVRDRGEEQHQSAIGLVWQVNEIAETS